MDDPHATQASLLIRVQNSDDQDSWRDFADIYGPLIEAYGRRHGLQHADASDVAQDVLTSIHDAIKRFDYDPKKGAFRGWLFNITRNQLRDHVRKHNRSPRATGETVIQNLLSEQPADPREEEIWNREHEQYLFRWAANQIRSSFQEQTWKAFWLTAVENLGGQQVADRLNISVGAVYIAKSRVLNKLKETIRRVEAPLES